MHQKPTDARDSSDQGQDGKNGRDGLRAKIGPQHIQRTHDGHAAKIRAVVVAQGKDTDQVGSVSVSLDADDRFPGEIHRLDGVLNQSRGAGTAERVGRKPARWIENQHLDGRILEFERPENLMDVGDLLVAQGILDGHLKRGPEDLDVVLGDVGQIFVLLAQLAQTIGSQDDRARGRQTEHHFARDAHLPSLAEMRDGINDTQRDPGATSPTLPRPAQNGSCRAPTPARACRPFRRSCTGMP